MTEQSRTHRWLLCLIATALAGLAPLATANAGPPAPPAAKKKPEFKPFGKVVEGYEEVVSTAGGESPMYRLWTRAKDAQMLAALPSGFARKRYYIAVTVASGERFAGLQAGDRYVYWRRYDKRLALIEPNLETRSTGDPESKSSVKRLFTDRVLLDIPIVTKTPQGAVVIDLDELLLAKSSAFFGSRTRGMNRKLAAIKTAKAFPHNIEVAYEVPLAGGQLKTLHYSISVVPENTGYKPRKADSRVGYFTTSYQDLGQYTDDKTWTRYINRWNLQKADPKLALSPPKNPIVFYVEHTTPIRYRRFVRDGIRYWNDAFEKIGIVDAIEVRFQDAATGAHMEKDPEDVRYNFIRWLNNDIGTAIGPSRVDPRTGEILDADIILTDGWIRTFDFQFNKLLPKIAMEGFGPEALSWFEQNPNWDPRLLLAAPSERRRILTERARRGQQPLGGHPMANVSTELLGDDEYDGLVGRVSQVNGLCLASSSKAFDLAMLRMSSGLLREELGEIAGKGDVLDGIPAGFIGPLLADLVAHEVGHTLGLRHNFCASALHSLDEINSEKLKGKRPFTASVMDYSPININMDKSAVQGDWAMISVGPYDSWAIEYGYTFGKDLKPILARCTDPEHQYATDEDTSGPDPLARRYDFTHNPLDYAKNQVQLARYHRDRLLTDFVEDGESWAKARRGYDMTLGLQMRAVSMMANWLGGAFVHRDKKGDKDDRAPVEPVPAARQRAALEFVIDESFEDDAFGVTADLLQHMSVDKWFDGGGMQDLFEDATYPLHDRIISMRTSVISMIMNPTTLRRIYDNELRVHPDEDCVTLPEVLETIFSAVWSELEMDTGGNYTARKPMISSLRRDLQRKHLERLIELSMPDSGANAAFKTIATLAVMQLSDLRGEIQSTLEHRESLDPYTVAHLADAEQRIEKALDAQYIINAQAPGGSSFHVFLKEEGEDK